MKQTTRIHFLNMKVYIFIKYEGIQNKSKRTPSIFSGLYDTKSWLLAKLQNKSFGRSN